MAKNTYQIIKETRREEIIDACEKLYQTMTFKEITMKVISQETSFTRPSIYNYFHTKEEIFLALLQREYERWHEELNKCAEGVTEYSAESFACLIARTLSNREQLLKLLSMNHYEMEENSRLERLTDFKVTFAKIRECFSEKLKRFFHDMVGEKIEEFILMFFPSMFGIYPYTHVTEKQLIAMKNAGIDFIAPSIYKMIYDIIIKLLV